MQKGLVWHVQLQKVVRGLDKSRKEVGPRRGLRKQTLVKKRSEKFKCRFANETNFWNWFKGGGMSATFQGSSMLLLFFY